MSNLCYGNSLVQALLACDAVKSGLARCNPAERAAAELLKIFNELDTSVNTPLSVEPLTQEVMARGDVGHQQDCMDMWSRLFQKLPLHIQSLFVGLETYKMTCMVCGKENEIQYIANSYTWQGSEIFWGFEGTTRVANTSRLYLRLLQSEGSNNAGTKSWSKLKQVFVPQASTFPAAPWSSRNDPIKQQADLGFCCLWTDEIIWMEISNYRCHWAPRR